MRGGGFTFFLLFCCSSLFAQGLYKEYGQNRVQYRNFVWEKLTFDNLDIVYYDKEELLANNALQIAIKELDRLESFLSYKYGGAMQLVVFSNLNDYRQSNIGYTNPQWSSGGFLVIPNDVSTVYFNGDYSNLQKQIRKAICDIMLREMIYGGTLQDRFERVRSPMLPAWFTEGLSAFLAESWTAEKENQMHNALATHQFNNFNNLTPEETVLAGHSIWRYLVEEYGAEAVSTIVFISRYTHSADAAIYFHTRKNIGEFLRDWREFYSNALLSGNSQNLPKGTSNIPKRISKRVHTDMALSPDGKTVALVTNDRGQYDIWTFQLSSGKVKHIYGGGQRVPNQLPDYDFPKLQWNPGTGNLSFISYEKGKYKLMEYANNSGKIKVLQELGDFTGILDFSFLNSGSRVVLSAVKNGRSDLFYMDLTGGEITRITNDLFHDFGVVFGKNNGLLFISNRPLNNDSIVPAYTNGVYNIFEIKDGKIHALTHFNVPVKLGSVISYNTALTGFLSDISGMKNAYILHADSGFQIFGQTNYRLGIVHQSISGDGKTLAELLLIKGKYHIFTSSTPEDPLKESVHPDRLKWKNTIENLDSLFAERNVLVSDNILPGEDSVSFSVIDSAARDYKYQSGFPKVDYQLKSFEDSTITYTNFKRSHFNNSLQPDYLLSQSENRTLGSYMFSNRIRKDALRNPMIMPYMKVSLADVLKNYIIEAGFRASLDLLLTDYTARFGFLKYRFDHDLHISRHMRKYEDGGNVLKQNLSVQGAYTLSYPFNEKSRIALSTGGRYEFHTVKGSETNKLRIPDRLDYYATSNLSYNYDNTTSLGLNMMRGLRANVGVDVLQRLSSNLMVRNLFADIRYYLPLYNKIIWANRFTSVYALGNGKVAYYLGAVENWTAKNQFESGSITLREDQYMFQQWVSNLRGFGRGVRVGSSFLLVNSELRIPVVQTLIRRPVESEFLRYFTITGFADYGTAFIGSTPADPSNPFNTIYHSLPNYDISITSGRNPYALGVGYGIRTRFLGYFVKFDHAWGYIENQWLKPLNYFSLGFDF